MSLTNPDDKRGGNRIHPEPKREGGEGRSSAKARRVRVNELLRRGNGKVVPCHWCRYPLDWRTVTADRLSGRSYARWNIVPADIECNQEREFRHITDLMWRRPMRTHVTQVRDEKPLDMPVYA